ncbi:MAG: FHA domain-containing protein [Burkholderiaceae bacterium]
MESGQDERPVKPARAAVIEVLGRDGQVRAVHRLLSWPARIGRSPDCEVVLDDVHLAAEHAQLSWDEQGGAHLRLLPSVNGGWLGERRLQAGDAAALAGTALFQLGASQLRWRSTAEPLAAELPLARHQQRVREGRRVWVALLLAVWLLMLGFDQWTALDPGSRWIDYSTPLLGALGGVLAWAALWSLVTQLFQHRFPFATHLRRALLGLVALTLLDALLPALAYAFSLPRLLALDAVLAPLGLAALLWWHASLVWPRARRGLALGLAAMLLVGGGLTVARSLQRQHWFGPPYMAQLPPPALRLVAPKSPEALIDSLRPLREQLARQARKDKDEAGDDDDD